jgi:hypothetical protein
MRRGQTIAWREKQQPPARTSCEQQSEHFVSASCEAWRACSALSCPSMLRTAHNPNLKRISHASDNLTGVRSRQHPALIVCETRWMTVAAWHALYWTDCTLTHMATIACRAATQGPHMHAQHIFDALKPRLRPSNWETRDIARTTI